MLIDDLKRYVAVHDNIYVVKAFTVTSAIKTKGIDEKVEIRIIESLIFKMNNNEMQIITI